MYKLNLRNYNIPLFEEIFFQKINSGYSEIIVNNRQ